jgi:hypothetical protein
MSHETWIRELIERLAEQVPTGYAVDGEPASEPTALAGLALLAHERLEPARAAGRWLAKRQSRSGAVGVAMSRATPNWPTAFAMMLWHALDQSDSQGEFAGNTRRALDWSLAEHGQGAPRRPQYGHDSTIIGWSWAADTHSWLEPTALFVLALKRVGHPQHARTREGVRLLIDRQLPNGGCNYGNTIVLGQPLLAHVQPTGLAMMALADEGYDDSRTDKSLAYLERELGERTTTASMCYGLLGLAAHGRTRKQHRAWLRSAFDRTAQQGQSPHKLALLALALSSRRPFQAAVPALSTSPAG